MQGLLGVYFLHVWGMTSCTTGRAGGSGVQLWAYCECVISWAVECVLGVWQAMHTAAD